MILPGARLKEPTFHVQKSVKRTNKYFLSSIVMSPSVPRIVNGVADRRHTELWVVTQHDISANDEYWMVGVNLSKAVAPSSLTWRGLLLETKLNCLQRLDHHLQ